MTSFEHVAVPASQIVYVYEPPPLPPMLSVYVPASAVVVWKPRPERR